jgi:hypothetical protein
MIFKGIIKTRLKWKTVLILCKRLSTEPSRLEADYFYEY